MQESASEQNYGEQNINNLLISLDSLEAKLTHFKAVRDEAVKEVLPGYYNEKVNNLDALITEINKQIERRKAEIEIAEKAA